MPSDPLILGFDTSAAHCAAALLSGERCLAARHEEMSKGQAERLLPLIAELLEEAGAARSDLTAIGVGIGPGNFTGIRISVAAARGLALALGIKAIGVSSLAAHRVGHDGPALCSVDARRDHLYVQRFGAGLAREPQMLAFDEIGPDWAVPGGAVIGHRADEIAARPRLGLTAVEPRFPIAEAISRYAATHLHDPTPRPAPLYLRAADAAPARERGPMILP